MPIDPPPAARRLTRRFQARTSAHADARDLIRRSRLIDPTWLGIQLDRDFATEDEAIDAYLACGSEVSPHPLFVPEWFDGRHRPPPGTPALPWYLNHPARERLRPHPLVSPRTIISLRPRAGKHPLGPVTAFLETMTDDTVLPAPQGMPPLTWAQAREASYEALRDHRRRQRHRDAPRTTPTAPRELSLPDTTLPAQTDGPLVSIVMPMFNRARTVREAIASVQAQTHQDWELLVVDDGSTDDSVAVVKGMAAFDDRIICIGAEHRGVSATRNTGIERARGRYLAFLDTDNTWRNGYLQVMLTELERSGWEMAHAALRATRDGQTYYRAYEGSHADLLVANHVDLNVLVARTDLVREVGGFDTKLRRGVDYDLILKLARNHDLHLVPYIGVDYVDDSDAGPRISTSESQNWLSVIASEHWVDWSEAARRPRVEGRTSVVMPCHTKLRRTVSVMKAFSGAEDCELVVVGVRQSLAHHVLLAVVARACGTKVAAVDVNRGAAAVVNLGSTLADGETLVLSLEGAPVELEDVRSLAAAVAEPDALVAQPVLVDDRDLVHSAGAVFATERCRPVPFLAEHPTHDLGALAQAPIPAALGEVVAVPAQAFADLHGLDPLFAPLHAATDLTLRLQQRDPQGRAVLVTEVRVPASEPLPAPEALRESLRLLDERHPKAPRGSAECWSRAALEQVGVRNTPLLDPATPDEAQAWATSSFLLPEPVVRHQYLQITEHAAQLRWTIDTASPSGPQGQFWGDTHFAEALATSLRKLGQKVGVDSRDARQRGTRDLDDVILVLRGLTHVEPRPGAVNLEWIISHPDLVDAAEISAFDRVYAASYQWPAEVHQRWGLHVHSLMQATDPALFHPAAGEFDSGPEVLFVGNSRSQFRPSVRLALEHDLDLALHGKGWETIIKKKHITSEHVSNTELSHLYSSAGLVLNDHWHDMRAWGFVSNRLMDAAASGARVLSDSVPGVDLAEMFHGLVRTWDSEEDFARVATGGRSLYPDGEERVIAARRVAEEHSFDTRAEQLLADAMDLRAGRS